MRLRAATAEVAEALQYLAPYVETNAEGIRNPPGAAPWGSGAVEKQVDVLTCRQVKTRGMRWYRPGTAALSLLQANADGDSSWVRRHQALALEPEDPSPNFGCSPGNHRT